jgi:signal transduction histidine kinase
MSLDDLNLEKENQILKKELEITNKKVELLIDLLQHKYKAFNTDYEEYKKYFIDEKTSNPLADESYSEQMKFLDMIKDLQTKYENTFKDLQVSHRKVEELSIKINEAERIKSEFLSNTSHEFRTPLNAILGFLELIKEGLYDTPEEMNEFLDGAIKSSHHLLKILSDFINTARAESKRIKINFEKVDLKTLLEEIYLANHIKAVTKGIDFQMELPEENLFIRGDVDKIKEIFENLLSNAFKFTSPNGKVFLKASETKSMNHVLCEINDNGIGISADNRKKIFERFYQVDGSSTREYGGTGIGLPLTKSYIELMGGFIGVNSSGKNQGSKFYFTLPVYHPDDEYDLNTQPADAKVSIAGNPNDPLILLVEDDSNYRKYISGLLVKNGFSTIGASTADDALLRMKEYPPNLIILDLALPRRDYSDLHHGIDLYNLLQNQPDFKDIPIIIISGHSNELIKMFHEDLTIKWDRFFEKPFDQSILIKKINDLLGKSS